MLINLLQLLKLYEEEMKDVVSLMEGAEVTDTRVCDYLRGLKSISEVYNKVGPSIILSENLPAYALLLHVCNIL